MIGAMSGITIGIGFGSARTGVPTPAEICACAESLTGQFLSGRRRIHVPLQRTPAQPGRSLRIVEARGNNLQDVTVDIPLGLMTCVTGVSGSGKSTLVVDTLYRHAATTVQESDGDPAPCKAVEGLEHIDRVIDIDQSPIGRTPRSNPATYTGIFGPVRELFAEVPEARARGYDPGRFSFNVRGGRCEACEGDGVIRVEMHFLPDAYVTCDACRGMRYNRETLEIRYKGRSIHDVLELTIEDAAVFFRSVPAVAGGSVEYRTLSRPPHLLTSGGLLAPVSAVWVGLKARARRREVAVTVIGPPYTLVPGASAGTFETTAPPTGRGSTPFTV
jgi:excinuclease ABC subunit A